MGEVYLARQLSLDRNVALKVLAQDLSKDPVFVARFTREAYAAAQLNHHNIVQIHDIGAEGAHHFFSMELVEGKDLAQTVKEAGRLDPTTAAGYILQAARGLKIAHDHGMVHRDIKPENLLLNDQGIVKVADLGLVKRTEINEDVANSVPGHMRFNRQMLTSISMGTPAYMPPEQAMDATHVDSRADIYALGCTLYDLLTGRPPFLGRSAFEVITKHQREPITPPEMIVRNIPKTLSAILLKMTAKRPQERYQSMTEVIRELEDFLGVSEAGPFTPRQEQIKALESHVEKFNKAGWAVMRSQLVYGFFAACGIGALVGWLTSHPLWAAYFVGFAVLTGLAYQTLIGVTMRTHIFVKVRQLIFGANPLDWVTWGLVAAMLFMLLVMLNWLGPWIAAAIVAVLMAMGLHFTIDVLVRREREAPLSQTEDMLKQLRMRGLDENAIRQFVCQFAGNNWEEFFETLFGYPAKIQARLLWGRSEGERNRRKYGAWRDPVIRWIERKQASRQQKRQQKLLLAVEASALKARGLGEAEIVKQAQETAKRVMENVNRIRQAAQKRTAAAIAQTPAAATAAGAPGSTAQLANIVRGVSSDWMKEAAEMEAYDDEEKNERERLSWFQRRFGSPFDLILGPQIRFVLATVILIGFGIWWQQNKAAPALEQFAGTAETRRQLEIEQSKSGQPVAKYVIQSAEVAVRNSGAVPLKIPHVPDMVTLALSGWNAALAGLILLVSAACRGKLMAITVYLAAAIALVGHWFEIPQVGTPLPWMSAAAAAILGFIGIMFLRRTLEV